MLRALIERLRQKHRTMKFPAAAPPPLPERFRGMPVFDPAACAADMDTLTAACPTAAISSSPAGARLDLGRCLFCADCPAASGAGAVSFTRDFHLAARERDALVLDGAPREFDAALSAPLRSLFGRSLKLRQVSAGGCNACEADINVLNTVGWDLARFGIDIVASPRHADGLLVTGPVTNNMRLALEKTYAAVPSPKIVIACGACAISGGPYAGHPEVANGIGDILPVDLYIPGCPPHPLTILDALLRMLTRA